MPAIKFCGASVTSVSSRLGWGNNKSTLEVGVIEDIRNGDFFNPPSVGMPCYFYFGPSFHFWGILENWTKQNNKEGLALYNIHVSDPRDLLNGVQLILDSYNGSTYGVSNILNCFGYWENLGGFGASNVNASGMPWNKILRAIEVLTNNPPTTMGGPISFRGVSYAVDLSNLPIPPGYYRIQGRPASSLLQVIQQVCDDAGYSFFVELDPGVSVPIIRVYTVSRYSQPPLGTIAQITNTNWGGTVIRANNGLTLRNEATTKFIIGGEQQTLYQTNNIQPYWGRDVDGTPIENMVVAIPDMGPNGVGNGYCNAAYVDCREVGSCFNDGKEYYFLTEYEMRAALLEDSITWRKYVEFETIKLLNTKTASIGPLGMTSLVNVPINNKKARTLAHFIEGLNQNANIDDKNTQSQKEDILYQWVKKKAQSWYGTKFWVYIPYTVAYLDPETTILKTSTEVTDGGWLPEGNVPFTLAPANLIRFTTEDNRYTAMAVFAPHGIDVMKGEGFAAEDAASQADGYYTKISVDKLISLMPNSGMPAVVISLSNEVKQQVNDITGDPVTLKIWFGQDDDKQFAKAMQGNIAWGTIDIRIYPPRLSPLAVAIPLKSNVSCYGPWYYAGPAGKVILEQRSDLTPWTFGGTDFMNMVATAEVTSAVTLMQEVESGELELVGMPLTSLGQTLLANGPNCTNIEIHYGREGIRTSYKFDTYSDLKLSRYQTATEERIKNLGRLNNTMKTILLTSLAQAFHQELVNDASRQMQIVHFEKWRLSWASPDPVFIGQAMKDDNGNVLVSTAVCDPTEAWRGTGALEGDTERFQNSAICSLSSIARPFANNPADPSLLPSPIFSPGLSAKLTIDNLNSFQQGKNDYPYLLGGNFGNSGFSTYQDNIDWNNIRGIAVGMPMMCAGWGFDINSNPTPTGDNQFYSPYYNVGPLDPLWDMNRGVWSVHDSIFGTVPNGCGPGGNTMMTIMGTTNKKVKVYNLFQNSNATIASGTIVCANYQPYLNLWAIIAADCPTS